MAHLIDLINRVYQDKNSVNILDVGGRQTYWMSLSKGFLQERNVTITILNLPSDLQGTDDHVFKHVTGNACDMPEFNKNAFDLVHSNSVIEHVGNWNKIKDFAREVNRVAPNLFVQTPYFWFPIEPHFVKPLHHWLPRPLRVSIFLKFDMHCQGRAQSLDEAVTRVEDDPYLLDLRMFRFLFPDSQIIKERFLFFTKSMVAFRSSYGING
jgi:hypothetical protein